MSGGRARSYVFLVAPSFGPANQRKALELNSSTVQHGLSLLHQHTLYTDIYLSVSCCKVGRVAARVRCICVYTYIQYTPLSPGCYTSASVHPCARYVILCTISSSLALSWLRHVVSDPAGHINTIVLVTMVNVIPGLCLLNCYRMQ